MLTQKQVDCLLVLLKKLSSFNSIEFPTLGSCLILDAVDVDERESFLLDVQRKGKLKPTKCTYQKRYQSVEILLRLDIDGPTHDNPDGESVPCPHIHIYREGYADKWAYPLPAAAFPDATDLVITLTDFLKYCKINRIPSVQRVTI